jgi:Uncharacterized conserved protein (DUF2358)
MTILQILQADYQNFPIDQTYEIYAEDVYFKDPMNEFRGRDRYKSTIGFIKTWFLNVKMDLHSIQQSGDTIRTDWTLHWNTPLPWKPAIAISGWSELQIANNLIVSHIDYWHCSKFDVLKQHFKF